MIITESRPKKEILKNLAAFQKIFIFGCGTCATKCQTGGEDQVKATAAWLKKNSKNITGFFVIESPCDSRLTNRARRQLKKEISRTEAALVLSCGAGVQVISDILEVPVIPGLDSLFLGKIENLRRFSEKCRLCGECLLSETGGFCVMALCPKGLQNGACAGSQNEKCEVDSERDCVWALIYKKLKKQKQLGQIFGPKPPKNLAKNIPGRNLKKI